MAVDAVGRLRIDVDVDDEVPAGTLLRASAELDTGSATEYAVFATAATPVREGAPLRITYESMSTPANLATRSRLR